MSQQQQRQLLSLSHHHRKRGKRKIGVSVLILLRAMVVVLIVVFFLLTTAVFHHHNQSSGEQQQHLQQQQEQSSPQKQRTPPRQRRQDRAFIEVPPPKLLSPTKQQPKKQQKQQKQQNQQQKNNNNKKKSMKNNNKKKDTKTIQGGEVLNGQLVKFDKQGNQVMYVVTSDKELGIDNLGNDDGVVKQLSQNISREDATKGREPLLEILKNAGVTDIDTKTILKLPTWEQITKLYGNNGPVIHGLETCEKFRNKINKKNKANPFIAVSGMFNTGTNPLFNYLNANCILPENERDAYGGIKWQVPWGKHMLADRKWTNTARNDARVNKTNVLPVVIVRDPYSWMRSLCRKSYEAKFPHTKNHCPNLVPNKHDVKLFQNNEKANSVHGSLKKDLIPKTIPVTIKYPAPPENKSTHWVYEWDSLVHLWNDWYRQYYDVAHYPRIIVRFEDLYFHVKELVTKICECGGGAMKYNYTTKFIKQESRQGGFAYLVDSGKFGPGHKKEEKTNLVSGMIKYGKEKKRFDGFTADDLRFAHESLDHELMGSFGYDIPPPPPP